MSYVHSKFFRVSTLCLALGFSSHSLAQQDVVDAAEQAAEDVIQSAQVVTEEMTVTGSRVFGQGETTSPLIQVNADAFNQNPSVTFSEFLRENVTANRAILLETDESNQSGQANTGNRSAGVNLWGLGEENSLTLLNGSRVINYAAPNGDGWYTNDANSVLPGIAMSRADILLDGGGAIYGTDAVAGVVNIIPRYGFEGVELQVQTDFYPDSLGDTGSNSYSGLFGTSLGSQDQGSLIAAFDYRATHRNDAAELGRSNVENVPDLGGVALTGEQFDEIFGPVDSTGYEWVYQPAMGMGMSATPALYYVDPLCGADIDGAAYYHTGIVAPDGVEESNPGDCAGYGEPDTTGSDSIRYTLFSAISWEFNEDWGAAAEIGYAYRENTSQELYPQNTGGLTRNTTTTVPWDNPAVQYYLDNYDWVQAGNLGGVQGGKSNGVAVEREAVQESETINIHASLDWSISDSLQLSLGGYYGRSEVDQNRLDFVVGRYQAALNGQGGPNCNGGTPGVGDCMWFNPFISALLPDAESLGIANDPSVAAWFRPDDAIQRFFKTEAWGIDAVLTVNTGIELPGGEIDFVVGGEYREEDASVNFNEWTRTDNVLASLPAGQVPYSGTDDVTALFVETVLPVTDFLKVQLAGRYDDYSSVGDTFNPKLGITFDATDRLSFRASYGTSFKAPTIAQTTPTISRGSVPNAPGGGRRGGQLVVRNYSGSPGLAPQEATHYSFGLDATLFEDAGPLERLNFSASYVNIEFEDRIDLVLALDRTQSGGIGNQLCGNVGGTTDDREWNTFYTTEDVDLDGTPDGGARCWDGIDPNGDGIIEGLENVTTDFGLFTNLAKSTMEGINFVVSSNWNTGLGALSAGINATYALESGFQANAASSLVDSVGLSGLGAFSTGAQVREWVATAPITLRWNMGFLDGHATTLTGRFDSDIKDADDGTVTSGGITTWDLRHRFQITDSVSASLTVRNITGDERQDPTPNLGAGDQTYLLQLTYAPGGN